MAKYCPTHPDETNVLLIETERIVASLWSEALQLTEAPAATDNFFSLGGDSMTMTLVEFRIKEELSVDLPAGSILAAPSLRELSELIAMKLPQSDDPPSVGI